MTKQQREQKVIRELAKELRELRGTQRPAPTKPGAVVQLKARGNER